MAQRPPDRVLAQGQSQSQPWPQSQSQSPSQTHELAPSPSPAAAVSAVRDTAAVTAPPPSHPSSIVPTSSTSAREPANMTMDVDSGADVDDRARRATSVLSMDDIEAAQALEGLRSDFSRPSQPPAPATTKPEPLQPEPLLSLLTSTHPLISSAINQGMSAYTSSKSYSPRFKYGAEFLERNIGSHVANTVGTISQKTGVEGGLRWALQRRDNGDANDRNKRRKVGEENASTEMDVEKALSDQQRARSSSELSYETLPPYDDQRSPKYEEINTSGNARPASTWQSRLMISTSGLGVAMSEESLRSLTYCLKWLRWANDRLSRAIVALKNVLQKWDESRREKPEETASNRAALSQHIQAVKEDVLRTLKQVVDIVSKYTGGALPENARNLVRRHLISLPQRFRIASTSQAPSDAGSDEATSAHRVLVLAQEGLDMMAQVSRVVNDTLVSAEVWCERLGRKRPDMKEQLPDHPDVKQPEKAKAETQDIEMGGTQAA
ncbi:hypothetical protein VTN96DRAFT_9654 [Rasamsonia emersonii]|uniref:Clock controled protein (Ccg-8) n=1 Tax=Rasamsonia emersonii (strain ATCC 16479 / CBS 393.64 / IMI 116815) TaxID=1408163 RepID=A0A0F4YYP8_RASE3|nr:Clock controled protein (Ccg-8) [Rasamsonia emersonii CBS 393.64]KKA23369.1 Clock controled protein (Ccg-8) [Rasamsonia emersonii CBS 393.64]